MVDRSWLERYDEAIQAVATNPKKAALADLDRWFDSLEGKLAQRDPRHITKGELAQLMQWKLTRGKWRPRLTNLVAENDESTVVEASSKAYASLDEDDVPAALAHLMGLKGVGVATASALLAAAGPDVPFMSDEVMDGLSVKREYTLKAYARLLAAVKEKVDELDGIAAEGGKEEAKWTPRDVERAAYSMAKWGCLDRQGTELKVDGPVEGAPGAKRRRRA